MTLEAAVAVVSGVLAHSLSLVAFGVDSVIELASAFVLMWRLHVELRRGDAFPREIEERASRIAGTLLFGLALYVVAGALWVLIHREGEAFSTVGFALAVVAMPAMFLLSRAKLRVAAGLHSEALRADAAEAIACGYLSLVVAVGLLAMLIFRAWWVDGVTSLAVAFFLLREGREAWSGGCLLQLALSAVPRRNSLERRSS